MSIRVHRLYLPDRHLRVNFGRDDRQLAEQLLNQLRPVRPHGLAR